MCTCSCTPSLVCIDAANPTTAVSQTLRCCRSLYKVSVKFKSFPFCKLAVWVEGRLHGNRRRERPAATALGLSVLLPRRRISPGQKWLIPSVQQFKDWTCPDQNQNFIFITVLILYFFLTCSKINLAFGLNKPESVFNKHISKPIN